MVVVPVAAAALQRSPVSAAVHQQFALLSSPLLPLFVPPPFRFVLVFRDARSIMTCVCGPFLGAWTVEISADHVSRTFAIGGAPAELIAKQLDDSLIDF